MAALDRRFVSRRLLPALACVALVVAGTVVVTKTTGTAASGSVCRESAPNFDPAWPQDTLTDWVSYSDQLSIVVVTSEQALSPLVETDENGGLVGRSVDLAVERTLWRREGAPSVGGTFPVVVDPWMVDGDDPHTLNISGGARLEVGERYIVPLTQVKTDEDLEWTVNGGMSVFPLEGSTIVCGSVREEEFTDEDISGTSVEELAARFAATEPDPLAVKYGWLDPDARLQAVARGQ